MQQICDDLDAERAALDAVVDPLTEDQWDTPTPAAGWSVRDQISHLWFFDQRALLAIVDADAFARDAATLMGEGGEGTDASVAPGHAITGAEMMRRWRDDRDDLGRRARTLDPSTRISWYGPAMGARSFLTARLMETWAHGQDVVDALGAQREATDRLRHVAHIGVRARPFSYVNNGMTMPERDVRVELDAPADGTWTWGESDVDVVSGPALDFCLVVTQRRHLDDSSLRVEGAAAAEWMSIAQAYAGPPGGGRPRAEHER